MSQFIMIAPEGWLLLNTEYYENNTDLTKTMFGAAPTTVIEVATAAMLAYGDMTESQTIEEIKIINDEYWVKLV